MVRFIGPNLVDENGDIILIQYQDLLQASLQEEYTTFSVREIIFTGVEKATGQKVIINNDVRKSSLFNQLEDDILKDPKYQERRRASVQKHEAYKPKRSPVSMKSKSQAKYVREKLIKRLRGTKLY